MTGQEMWDLSTDLLSGRGLSEADFFTRANLVKKDFEGQRPWRKLIKKDIGNTSSTSDTYLTAHNLPTSFRKTLPRRTLKLYSGSQVYPYDEIPFENLLLEQNSSGKFAIDHANKQYYICGTVPTTLTHELSFIGKTADIDKDTTEWIFDDYAEYIPYTVVARVQLGEDYDDINARNANANVAVATAALRRAIKEDDALQRSALGV